MIVVKTRIGEEKSVYDMCFWDSFVLSIAIGH